MISDILRHIATHLLSRLVEQRLKADALRTRTEVEDEKKLLLSYSVKYRILWAGMTLLWGVVVLALAWLWWHSELEWRLLVMSPIFFVLLFFSALLAKDGFTQEIELSSWGLSERRRGVVVASFPWSELEQVRFLAYLDSYKLIPRQGRTVRLGMHIRGIAHFKACVATYARPEAFEGIRSRISNLKGP